MENPTKNSVLITGINGFTGRHLETLLVAKGFNVYGTTFSEPQEMNHLKCDILNLEELKKIILTIRPDYVFHLAAISFVAAEDIIEMYKTNTIGTLNLLDALYTLNISPTKIVIASSAAVYGNVGSVLSEEMCPKPVNHYGNSKLAMENMVVSYFDKLNIIVSRPFNYTGVGQEDNFLIPKIVRHFKERRKIIELGNIDTFREYNDVGFLVDCYEKLIRSDFKSGVVNIASGKTYSIKKILELMKNISSHNIEIKINDQFVRKNEIKELKGSSKKLTKLIGKPDIEFSLRKTLNEMYIR